MFCFTFLTRLYGIFGQISSRILFFRVERFIKQNGYDIELEYGAFPDRPYDSKAVWGNSAKIEKIMTL